MKRTHLPLNALRMFDAAARHLSLTRAAQELHVTQAAVSQHIRNLEERLGKPLFRRLPRGLALTDEGQALWPVVTQSFERIQQSLQQVAEPRPREILTVGVVGTFAIGWLIPRLSQFQQLQAHIDLRLLTNNNRCVNGTELGVHCGANMGFLLGVETLAVICTVKIIFGEASNAS